MVQHQKSDHTQLMAHLDWGICSFLLLGILPQIGGDFYGKFRMVQSVKLVDARCPKYRISPKGLATLRTQKTPLRHTGSNGPFQEGHSDPSGCLSIILLEKNKTSLS